MAEARSRLRRLLAYIAMLVVLACVVAIGIAGYWYLGPYRGFPTETFVEIEHAHAALTAPVCELNEIPERSIARIYAIVIRDIVSVVSPWRGLKGHEPDGSDPKPLQIIQAAHEPLEIANAIAVRVHERSHREAIDDCVFVPEIINHAAVCCAT